MDHLTLHQLHKSYDHHPIIKNMNLSIKEGEFIVLLGPSGCGKSTLLQLVAGLEPPHSGQIFLRGKEITHLPPKDRDMAMVFQSYALYPTMTVKENLSFALEIKKIPSAERETRVQEVASMLQISHLLSRKPHQLSGGQRQRVAIGRALARNPQTFLFDEPLSNLDAKLRSEMRLEIKKLHQKLRWTALYVTHDQTEAMTLADRIAIIKEGEIQQFDTPERIYHFPYNQFVAEFMGLPACNFLPIHSVQRDLQLSSPWVPPFSQKEFLMAFRPEYFQIRQNHHIQEDERKAQEQEPWLYFPGEIKLWEHTGMESFLTLSTLQGQTLQARFSSEKVKVGQWKEGEKITLNYPLSKVSFFDNQSKIGLSIS